MKTIEVTENLPEVIDIEKLSKDLKFQYPGVVTRHKLPIDWGDGPVTEKIIIDNLDESVNEQDVINIVTSHKANGLLGAIHACEMGCDCDLSKLYRTLRRNLISYVAANYQTMTADELKEASSHFCTPAEVRDQFYTMQEQIELGDIFNKRATEDRQIRSDRVISTLMNYLTYLETVEIINDLGDLVEKYIKFGVEGVSEGDPVGLFDYFESTPGTTYESTGLLSKQYTPRGSITILQLSQIIMSILRIS